MKILVAVYAVINAVAWWLAAPQEFGDTYRYFGSTLFDIQNPGITPVLIYTTIEDPAVITAFQVVLQALAFSLLALEVRRSVPSPRLGLVIAVLLLALSLTQPVWSWTQLLGSESLTVSAAVLWIAALLWLRRVRDARACIAACAATVLVLVTRPMLSGVVLTSAVLLAIVLWRPRRGLAIALVATSLVSFVYGVARLAMLSSDPDFRVRYAIGNFIDKTPSFRVYAIERMPACEPLVAAVNGPAPWDDGWQFQGSLASTCPETYLWMRSSATSTQAWVPALPDDAWVNFVGVARELGYIGYTPWSGIPQVGELPGQTTPTWLLTLFGLGTGLVLTVMLRGRLRWNSAAAACIAIGTASIVATSFVVWSADGIEHSRHLQPLTSLLPIVALVIVPIGFSRPSRGSSSIRDVQEPSRVM